MRIFLLSVYFYLSNLYFDAISAFSFAPNFFEFIAIFLAIFFINSFSLPKSILGFWAFLYFCSFSYISFAGHIPSPFEISLFWSHLDETFESFLALLPLFIAPFVFFCGATLLIISQKTTTSHPKLFVFLMLVLYFVPFGFADASLNLIKSTAQSFWLNTTQTINQSVQYYKPQYASKYKNIIVIIGESMRHDKLSLFGAKAKYSPNLEALRGQISFKKIYANGTNTDVALPLFFNNTQNLRELQTGRNLFSMAKNANYNTHFVTTQTEGYLKYIKPYLGVDVTPQILGTKNDLDLPKYLDKFDLTSSNFIVFQMMGQHSPYKFYDKKFDKFSDYENCILQSDFVLSEIFKFAIKHNIAILYFSDHGELLGENDGFFGHNSFVHQVYEVPFIWANFKEGKQAQSQHDIAKLLEVSFGYQKVPAFEPIIKVNGSMITGEDGFREFKR